MSDSTTAGGNARTDDDESATIEPSDLTKFQVWILAVLSDHGGAPKGLDIKTRLASYYDEDINHGRLYPNLDKLVDAGYVEKGTKDRRTNSYAISNYGLRALQAEVNWLVERTPVRGGDSL